MTSGGEEAAVLVYGVVGAHPPAVPEDAVGPDGAALRQVMFHDLAAVVGGVMPGWRPGREDLVRYSSIVDGLAQHGPVVPVQFGSLLADEQEVVDRVLAPEAERLSALLEELAGKVQVQIRARYVEEAVLAEVVAADPEVRDLRERTKDLPDEVGHADRIRLGELAAHAVAERAAEDADTVLDVVRPHVTAEIIRPVGGLDVLDVVALVEAEELHVLEDALEALAEAAHDRMRIRLVGPTAPYDFVGGD